MSKIRWFNYKKEVSKTDIYASNENELKLPSKMFLEELDLAWFNFFIKDAQNGRVLISNTYKKDFSKIRLAHLTPSFDEIIKTGKIFSSGGGLGVAVYCSPLHEDNTVHNIFEQYLSFQLPKNTNKKIFALLIEVELEKENLKNIENWGVDYTQFGEIECKTWEKLKQKMEPLFVRDFSERIYRQIKENEEAINLLIGYKLKELSYEKFERLYNQIFIKIPSLRFILYETLAEYILLYQNNKKARDYSLKGELYNLPHKKFISDLCPSMLKKFNMVEFFIPLEKIIEYLSHSDIFDNFNKEHFKDFIKWRVGFYLKKVSINSIKDDIKNFNDLVKKYPSLLGQVIYREFYDKRLFEQERAKIIYSLFKKENLICPIYSILPKGEVGINPYLDKLGLNYQIFEAEFDPSTKKLNKLSNVKIKLDPEIITKSKSTVR